MPQNLLVGDSGEETKKNVAAFIGQFDAAVQDQMESRIAGTTPKGGKGAGALSEEEAMAAKIDKYHLSKLCAQRLRLYWQRGFKDQ